MSSNINIVLVNTSHPGNIGSTARAMKTMGLNQLTLVSPKDFPSKIANAKAVGCTDILDNAKVTSLLSDAVSNSKLIVGFSARSRKSNIPSLSIDELNKLLSRHDDEVSIVFGNEQSGLSNEDLRLCNYIVTIPTDKAYSSLNLAFAVQIFSYELFKFRNSESKTINKIDADIAKQSTKNHLIEVFLSIMTDLNIITDQNKRSLTQNIYIIFNKLNINDNEANLFLGVLKSVKKALKK